MWSIVGSAAPPASGYRTQLDVRLRPPAVPWKPWLSLVGLALLVKVAIVGLALAELGTFPDPIGAVLAQWNHWDAPHYLYLATHGYTTQGDARNLIAFFPLYPALILALTHVGLPAAVAALFISNVGGLAAAILLFEIGRHDADEAAGWRAAALFTLFPTAYFLFAGYTEGFFCALAFGSVLAARRRRWGVAGLLGGLAAATRLTGIALLPMLAVELYLARHALVRVGRALAGLALVPLGLLAYLGLNWVVFKNPLMFVQIQREHWYHELSAPWVGFLGAYQSLYWRTGLERLTVGAGELAGGLVVYGVGILTWLKLRPSDAAYAAVVTILTTFLPFWLSIPRYLLALYPLFLLAGRVRNPIVQVVAAAISVTLLLILSLTFAKGYWAF